MESNSNTGKIVGIIIVAILLIGGIVWAVSSSSDSSNNDTSQTQEVEQPNIVELAQSTPELSTLVDAIVAADLVETLSTGGPFTVFAPTNDAFAALPAGTLDSLLLPENQDQLVDILTYHVVAGEAFSSDLSDGQTLTTLQGGELTVRIADDGTVTVGGAKVILADADASNGVVHVIDAVLLPQ